MSVALYPTRTRAPRGVRTSATSASPLRGPARVPLSSSVIFVSSTYFGWRGGDRVRAAHAATAREKKRARSLLPPPEPGCGWPCRPVCGALSPHVEAALRNCRQVGIAKQFRKSSQDRFDHERINAPREKSLRKLMRERSSALALVLWCCATPGSLVERASRGPRPPREAGSWSPCCSRPMSSACARSL